MGTKFIFLELTRRILDEYKSICRFAKVIGICELDLKEKLNNLKPFGLEEIVNIFKVLNISDSQISNYIF